MFLLPKRWSCYSKSTPFLLASLNSHFIIRQAILMNRSKGCNTPSWFLAKPFPIILESTLFISCFLLLFLFTLWDSNSAMLLLFAQNKPPYRSFQLFTRKMYWTEFLELPEILIWEKKKSISPFCKSKIFCFRNLSGLMAYPIWLLHEYLLGWSWWLGVSPPRKQLFRT